VSIASVFADSLFCMFVYCIKSYPGVQIKNEMGKLANRFRQKWSVKIFTACDISRGYSVLYENCIHRHVCLDELVASQSSIIQGEHKNTP
jgi:hypothetical protein